MPSIIRQQQVRMTIGGNLDVLILITAVHCIDGLSDCFASGKATTDASVAETTSRE